MDPYRESPTCGHGDPGTYSYLSRLGFVTFDGDVDVAPALLLKFYLQLLTDSCCRNAISHVAERLGHRCSNDREFPDRVSFGYFACSDNSDHIYV